MFTSRRHIRTVGATAALLLITGTALAHARLVKSDPAADAQVPSPKAITLTFNEALSPAFSKVQVGMADGAKVAATSAVSADKKSLIATPTSALAPGTYTVSWQAASSDDGHKMEGKFNFTVK